MDESLTMGAITSNRKRGYDYFKSPLSSPNHIQSNAHISKKFKHSIPSMNSTDLNSLYTAPSSSSSSSSSITAKLSSYPDRKKPLSRVPHAPVRNSRFASFSIKNIWKNHTGVGNSEGSSHTMGNHSGKYEAAKDAAFRALRYLANKDERVSLREDKGKQVIEVIEVDDGEDMRVDVSDDSSIEEVGVFEHKEHGVKSPDKQFRSLDSSVVSDVTNVGEKIDLVVLEGSDEDMGLSSYKKLYKSSQKRDAKLRSMQSQIELSARRMQWFPLLWPRTKPKEVKKDRAEECFVALTNEEDKEVGIALHAKNRSRILVSHQNSNIDITGEKLQCLRPKKWLNDEVINVYLELLKEREKREPQNFLKCHFFSTFFYKKLISKGGYNYQQVRRWTTQRKLGYNLLECDKIFVPIHQQIHWCLAVINRKEKKFQYLDSLKGIDEQVLDDLRKYYVDEVKDKNGKEIDVSSWDVEYVRDLPAQKNGFDCGMFMIKYADFYSRDLGLCFGQEHMPYFRKRTVKELLRLRAE